MLAVCHIDGNSMGIHIREKIEGICEYGEAMKRMREISKEISDTFRSVFDGMAAFMDELSAKVRKISRYSLFLNFSDFCRQFIHKCCHSIKHRAKGI